MPKEIRLNEATFEAVVQEVIRAVSNSSDSENASNNVTVAFERAGLLEAKESGAPLQKSSEIKLTINIINYYSREVHMSTFNNTGSNIAAQGDLARSDHNTQNIANVTDQPLDLAEFMRQLDLVREELEKRDADRLQKGKAIGVLATAEENARANNKSGAVDALKSAGGLLLDVAKSVSAKLIEDAIEGKFGV
ncbi:hypothetical protein [Methylocystis iwaonis]|uniref:Uncharacterized protein n=1 Tax=Methylocystis iwaonis TaxID=2885079 RepID=A0ABN6VLQ6_9HYPH|nr:hypothetical protein [Methylocystis iwaonis]BDV36714.1 hypothetical protein SS37A_42440 [Methylocystis iwaonis]